MRRRITNEWPRLYDKCEGLCLVAVLGAIRYMFVALLKLCSVKLLDWLGVGLEATPSDL